MTHPEAEPVDQPTLCPHCQHEVQAEWISCPSCGLQLKPAGDILPRAAVWLLILTAYLWATVSLWRKSPAEGQGFAVLFGLPLCYTFGKAVLFRLMGRPLSWNELGATSFRVFVLGFLVMVVAPFVIGAAFVLLLLAVCSAIGPIGPGAP